MAGVPRRTRRRTQRRPCLRCDRVFPSAGPHNRLCARCRDQLNTSPAAVDQRSLPKLRQRSDT
jgi:hypothetical protein